MTKYDYQLFWTEHVDAGTLEVNPVNVTTQASMSATMKDFYNTFLLENARENMVFTQLGEEQAIHGNTVEWRKFNTFPKALTPLTEGVIPAGQTFGMTKITASTEQYGDYVTISDRLELEAVDDIILGATEEMGATEGETYDTLTRNILVAGNSVLYAPKINASTSAETEVTSRKDLDETAVITPKLVNRAYTWLKKNKAPLYDGSYVWVIHPSQAFDLRQSKDWVEAQNYAQNGNIFNGEIGRLHKFRFIESTAVKVYAGANLTEASRNLTVKTAVQAGTSVAVNEAITADEATALAGRKILDASGNEYTIASATAGNASSASLTLSASATIAKDAVLYPAGGGARGLATYASLAMGKGSFAVVKPEGEGMQMYIKNKGEIGGPLEQFSTVGYKFNHGAKILYQERILRVETGSFYSDVDEEN